MKGPLTGISRFFSLHQLLLWESSLGQLSGNSQQDPMGKVTGIRRRPLLYRIRMEYFGDWSRWSKVAYVPGPGTDVFRSICDLFPLPMEKTGPVDFNISPPAPTASGVLSFSLKKRGALAIVPFLGVESSYFTV